MHQLQRKVDVSIRSLYVFNSTYGDKEGEEKEKILFYHPKDIELNAKITDVGLSQAFTTFTDNFTDEIGGCEVIHTEKAIQLLYQAEPNFWLVLVLNVPKLIQSKDGVDCAEYQSYELHDDIYRRILMMAYERFCLEQGTFQIVIEENNENSREVLVDKLEEFFDKYIPTIKLPADDILEFMRSLQYLPLDKVLFLRVHNFIESIKSTYPTIADSLFLYKESIVTCGRFNSSGLYTLHRYITEQSSTQKIQPITREAPHTIHKVYININGQVEPYRMVIYSSNNAKLCVFFKHQCNEITEQYLEDLGCAIHSQLYVLSQDTEEYLNTQASTTKTTASNVEGEYGSKYVFVNEQSFKMMTNLIGVDVERKTSLSQNVINLIADLFTTPQDDNAAKSSIPCQEEIMVKSTDDFWVIKRRGNYRQRFVIMFSSKPLLDMTKEAERIFEQDIKDGVFSDK